MTKLRSYKEYQQDRMEQFRHLNTYPQPTGVSCPECKKGELKYTDSIVLASYPPKRNVKCDTCKWKGYL